MSRMGSRKRCSKGLLAPKRLNGLTDKTTTLTFDFYLLLMNSNKEYLNTFVLFFLHLHILIKTRKKFNEFYMCLKERVNKFVFLIDFKNFKRVY